MENKSIGSAAIFVQAVTEFIFVEDTPQQSDVIFIPGNAHPEHVLRAAALYHQGFAPYLLPSGRFAKSVGAFAGMPEEWRGTYTADYPTEWDFMRDVLRKEGVPDQAILQEDQATYTWDNAQKSRAVTDAAGITVRRGILCCHAAHARRALLYYQAAFPESEFLVCPAHRPGLRRDDWYLTERGRKRILGEVARCGAQVSEVLEDFINAEMLRASGEERP
jgi:uncharacterized SAM-binding protein YcdF (DUF218 family)